jgi:hypothetical protein
LHDHRHAVRFALQPFEDGHAVHVGHDQVKDHGRDRRRSLSRQARQGSLATGDALSQMAQTADNFLEVTAFGGIVIDNQDSGCHIAFRLKCLRVRVPAERRLSTARVKIALARRNFLSAVGDSLDLRGMEECGTGGR